MSHDHNLERGGNASKGAQTMPRSPAMDALQGVACSRVVSIVNLFGGTIVAISAFLGRSNPGPPFDSAFFRVTGIRAS